MGNPSQSHLVVPLLLWGEEPPSHVISSILISHDHSMIVTGSVNGQLCVWDVNSQNYKVIPRFLLLGHTSAVKCLAPARNTLQLDFVVSASDNGEVCCWDLIDGMCIEAEKMTYIHSHIQSYPVGGQEDAYLFCVGNYPDILVVDPFTLEVITVLASRYSMDWLAAIHVLHPSRRQDDVILGLTCTGVVKVWTIGSNELLHPLEPVLEHESKQIQCSNAIGLKCCLYNQRTVIVVTPTNWEIYDAGDFSLLCTVASELGIPWLGGDFLATDRVIAWNKEGRAFLYRLPKNCVVESKEFHNKSSDADKPFLYCILEHHHKNLPIPPSACYSLEVKRDGRLRKILMFGDAYGSISIFDVPEITENQLEQLKQLDFQSPPCISPSSCSSLKLAWKGINTSSIGVAKFKVTSSIYIPTRQQFVYGRDDGVIVLLNGIDTIKALIFENHSWDFPNAKILVGHFGRITCLLYPHQHHARYDPAYLVSGSADFSICLWDIVSESLLHKFSLQSGEISQILVPPPASSPRVLNCVCSVAKDHSVCLISVKERKCVLLSSRHLFPVACIKWRPLDDFMMVSCLDGTLYVWQMETGLLDRVVHGMAAEEILNACDESTNHLPNYNEGGLANPAVHFFRGLKHRNIAAIRHAALRGFNQLQNLNSGGQQDLDAHPKEQDFPLTVQGLRTNAEDSEFHMAFFDVEALIIQLLRDEYGLLSPNSLEAHGFSLQSEYQKVAALTQSASPDAQKKIAGKVKDKAGDMERRLKDKDKHGIFTKVREGAESIQQKIQGKSEFSKSDLEDGRLSSVSQGMGESGLNSALKSDTHSYIGRILISLLHAWNLDKDLDHICLSQLDLLKPIKRTCFGFISRSGYMMLMLPSWHKEVNTEDFTSTGHWTISSPMTTHHVLTIVSLSNTFMSLGSTASSEAKAFRKAQGVTSAQSTSISTHRDGEIMQGWSLMATLHCVLLPDKVKERLSRDYGVLNQPLFKKILVECLARRWQDRCMEIREAAQALLLAELERLGEDGRQALVDEWSLFLPAYADLFAVLSSQAPPQSASSNPGGTNSAGQAQSSGEANSAARIVGESDVEEDQDDEDDGEDVVLRRPNRSIESKRRQAIAVVLLGVIGAEFGQEICEENRHGSSSARHRKPVEGFGVGHNQNLARLTSKALTYLLLAPPSHKLPLHTPLRRAAIDLIGRGFTTWEPHLDVSKVLLALLELCSEGDRLIPSINYGLPLHPAADSCRTARHALSLIASARPAAFITTMAREVARFNTLQQNAQTLNVNLAGNILSRSKPEILRIIENLTEKMQAEISDLLTEVIDIVLHCVDHGHLKSRSLFEVFPALTRFHQISHCASSRRIAVGSRSGTVALYDLRGSKCQFIQAHSNEITACAFSPDGKNLATYSCSENRLSLWQQSSTGVFGLGSVQTRCIKTYSTQPIPDTLRTSHPDRLARLQWLNGKSVALMLPDGSESRYHV